MTRMRPDQRGPESATASRGRDDGLEERCHRGHVEDAPPEVRARQPGRGEVVEAGVVGALEAPFPGHEQPRLHAAAAWLKGAS